MKGNIAVIGCGGNGLLASLLLSSMKYDLVRIIDGDTISSTDLGRQSLYSADDIGKNKAEVAFNKIKILNGNKNMEFKNEYLDSYNVETLLYKINIVLDATDSFKTRELINQYCVREDIPWVMTSSYGHMGQLKFINPGKTSCLECMTAGRDLIPINCHYDSVEPYVPQSVSSISTSIVSQFLSGVILDGDLRFIDFNSMEIDRIKIERRPSCKVCQNRIFPLLTDEKIKGRQLY